MPTLVGVFEQPGDLAQAIRQLKGRGLGPLEFYSPSPFLELDEAMDARPSRVRVFTLVGGLLGVTTGYAMTIWMSLDWPIMIGGKPYASIPPYTIIAFELTILLGGLFTLLGLLAVGRLPWGGFGRSPASYSSRFSAEDLGLVVTCADRDVVEVEKLLRAHAAREVSLVEA
jgi:hypothetical protein